MVRREKAFRQREAEASLLEQNDVSLVLWGAPSSVVASALIARLVTIARQ
jgi:hypothetical protein